MKLNKEYIAAAVFVLVLSVVGATGYYYATNNSGDTTLDISNLPSAESEGGTIAVLRQGTNFAPGITDEQSVASSVNEASPQVAGVSDEPYKFPLPAGWSLEESKTETDSCGSNNEVSINTYKNGAETIVVYENGHPGGCDRSTVADVYLDFDFKEDGTGVIVNTSTISQCSKADNPACPKGDGRVSLYIGNETADDPTVFTANKLTDKTYFFSLEDTSIDPDFTKQVAELAKIVELIVIR